jgi:regulator of sirC expression with transglutaminase-like and TPR domain
MQTLTDEQDEARRRPVAPGMDEELRQELADMTQDKYQSGEEAHSLRTQLANALILADPQAMEDRGQRFPDSTDFSGSDRTQLRRWITQLRMVP